MPSRKGKACLGLCFEDRQQQGDGTPADTKDRREGVLIIVLQKSRDSVTTDQQKILVKGGCRLVSSLVLAKSRLLKIMGS